MLSYPCENKLSCKFIDIVERRYNKFYTKNKGIDKLIDNVYYAYTVLYCLLVSIDDRCYKTYISGEDLWSHNTYTMALYNKYIKSHKKLNSTIDKLIKAVDENKCEYIHFSCKTSDNVTTYCVNYSDETWVYIDIIDGNKKCVRIEYLYII